MAINPPQVPEDDDPDTPRWVKNLFGRLADKIEVLEQKVSESNVSNASTSEGQESTTNDKPESEAERKPKRKSSWVFRD